jgi:exopolyphosphatase/guanosine-5'-triphosphate,3'-diphosphate pyrophosphatase
MLDNMVFAAIDIGSNAMRLLFCRVQSHGKKVKYSKEELIRMPIRLGEDVFNSGEISNLKQKKLFSALKGFKHLIDAYEVNAYRAVATSAMRDAKNGDEILNKINEEIGLKIETIDGKDEASLIFSNHTEDVLNPKSAYLYIDVGGGSTELTLYSNGKVLAAKSFNIGTLRMLYNKLDPEAFDTMKKWIRKYTEGVHPISAVGSGGNINKLFKMSGKKETRHLSFEKLKSMYEMLNAYTVEERIQLFNLKPDRADVISYAAKIFITVMKNADINKVHVPQIGVSDGIIHELYNEFKSKK